MLPKRLQQLVNEFGVADHPEPFDYFTDLPALECPSCCDSDSMGLTPIRVDNVFGLQCLRCFATVTGPYLRGEKPIPPYDGMPYCYTTAADWSVGINAAGQVIISQRKPDDPSKPIYQYGSCPAYVASILRHFDPDEIKLDHPHFTQSAVS